MTIILGRAQDRLLLRAVRVLDYLVNHETWDRNAAIGMAQDVMEAIPEHLKDVGAVATVKLAMQVDLAMPQWMNRDISHMQMINRLFADSGEALLDDINVLLPAGCSVPYIEITVEE
jgi:hypothetical protein